MIDYYLHKKCPLVSPPVRQIENVRCNGCVWFDRVLHKCIFSLRYPKSVSLKDFKCRLLSVNKVQQSNLSEIWQRFVYDEVVL